ncbi:organic cation transporter protein-like [Acropora muricata]|uniref:organic cation transporter protein-like n=1 Tax=Acropora muricata TaxID=159855 RepID=UPI0034E5C70E
MSQEKIESTKQCLMPTKKPTAQLQFDDLLSMVGGFGRYPFLLFAFMCVVAIPAGLQQLILVFNGATPDKFSCVSLRVPQYNESCQAQKCCSNCTNYDFSGRLTSAVTEWDLICDRKHLKAVMHSVYMAGLLFGSVVFSIVSDFFGRKTGVFSSVFVMCVSGALSSVADCFSLFTLFRFLAGAGTMGCILVRFVYCMEIVQINQRTAGGIFNNMFVTGGFLALSLFAYLIRDWRYLMLAASLPGIPLLLFWWLIPETPRWLIAKNRLEDAHQLLMKYATVNGKQVDSTQLMHAIQELKKEDDKNQDANRKTYSILDVFRTAKLRKRTIICSFNWFVNALVFFGMSLNVGNLAGDMYLNFFILSLVEIPGALLIWFFMARYGRRIPYASFMIFVGLTGMLVLAVPPDEEYRYIVTTLAVIGKACIISTFLGIYVFTVELYPTVIRNTGMGVCSTMARIGSIISPYIVLLADLPGMNKTLPLVIFGVLGLIAGIMALWLPETLYSPMPQTVEESEAWEEDYRIYCCGLHKRINEAEHGVHMEQRGTGEEHMEAV